MYIEQKVIDFLSQLLKDLIDKNYKKISESVSMEGLSIYDIERVLYEYGGKLTLPLDSNYYKDALNIIEIKENIEYHVEFDLCIDNQQSDLTLICNINFENYYVKKVLVRDILIL